MWSATEGGLWRPARAVGVSQAAGAALYLLILLSAGDKLVTFAQTQTTTVSWEVEALHWVFEQWNVKANTQQWNTVGLSQAAGKFMHWMLLGCCLISYGT